MATLSAAHPRCLGAARRPGARGRRARAAITLACAVSLLLAMVVLVGAPASPAPADGRRTTTLRVPAAYFGLHDGSLASYRHLDVGSVRLWDAGVRWSDVETARGVFDWSRLDALVSAAQAHGTKVTLVLAMTPSFAGPAENLPPTRLADYAAYVRAVMTRYRDVGGSRGIAAYQVWNEGNVPIFWDGTPAALARMTRIVDRVRDAVDPGAAVIAPSFAVRYVGERRWVRRYDSQEVRGTPVWRHYDASGFSLYPMARYGGRPGGPEDAMHLLGLVRRTLSRAGVPAGKPVWGTEINYGLKGGGSPSELAADPISEGRQVAYVLRTYLLGAARGLARMFWYRYDWGRIAASQGGGTLGNTLLTTPGRWDDVTRAGRALTTAQHWLSGRLVGVGGHRPCARDRLGTFACVVRHSGGTRTVYWNPLHRVTLKVRGAVSREDQSGRRTPMSGRVSRVTVGFRPVAVLTR